MMSQLNTISSLKKVFAICFLLLAVSFSSIAQTCPSTLISKTGTVLSARPAVIKKRVQSNTATVKVFKTGGRAQTQVNIYVNNQYQSSKVIRFNNGSYTDVKLKSLSGVRNKEIKVEIVNQSVGNTFKYKLEINGASSSLSETKSGSLVGQQSKTIITKASCTGKTEIKIDRTSGKARGNIRVWQKVGSNWIAMNNLSGTLEKNERNESIIVNSNKALKVELKNVSVGNTLGYRLYAKVKN